MIEAVGHLADHFHVGFPVDKGLESLSNNNVIVRQQNRSAVSGVRQGENQAPYHREAES